MPNRMFHEQFDEYLSDHAVLLEGGRYGTVHSFMDRGVKTFGAMHRELDLYHQQSGLRRWLNGKYNLIGQDQATDWLRAGLGHICLDQAESSLPTVYSWKEVFDSAYRSMAQKGWNRSRFVPR